MVKEDGTILNYDYINGRRNVDMINAGKILFDVYEQTGNPKYKKAMDLLYNAMMDRPRNSLGGFWHKEVYPWQMWLDGLYMASPYLAQYAQVNNKPELLNVLSCSSLLLKFMRDRSQDCISMRGMKRKYRSGVIGYRTFSSFLGKKYRLVVYGIG